jgi:threonine dehydrogenase-like Zn-dependent dehydrogenase
MRGLVFTDQLELKRDLESLSIPPGEALIRSLVVGICNTDIEIVRGYFGFQGILGHEFVGVVEKCPDAPQWEGKRVVGEINAWCGECPACHRGDESHCPNRTTLGIFGRDGAMADYFLLPHRVLYEVPNSVSDEEAVFTEPLAAACEIPDQVSIRPQDRVVVVGDGKLGLLCAQVLHLTGCELVVVGKHLEKLDLLRNRGIKTCLLGDSLPGGVDIVVEATGNEDGFQLARQMVRPRGTIVLKSTYHGTPQIDLSMIVVDEIRLIGSRCGPFGAALRLLSSKQVDVTSLISDRFPFDEALTAFQKARENGVLKVLLDF